MQISAVHFFNEEGNPRIIRLDPKMVPETRVTLAFLLLDALKQAVSDPHMIYPAQGVPNARAVRSLGSVCEMLLRTPREAKPDHLDQLDDLVDDVKRLQEVAATGHANVRPERQPTWEKQRDDLQHCYAMAEELIGRIRALQEQYSEDE